MIRNDAANNGGGVPFFARQIVWIENKKSGTYATFRELKGGP